MKLSYSLIAVLILLVVSGCGSARTAVTRVTPAAVTQNAPPAFGKMPIHQPRPVIQKPDRSHDARKAEEEAQHAPSEATTTPHSECGHPATAKASEEEGDHNREAVERGEPEPCPPEAPHGTLAELQANQEAEQENRRIEAREEACLASSGVRGC
jgi:hypothetical protein